MKLSKTVIFLILLLVLLISVIFAYSIPEGFISYNNGGVSLSQVVIPPYSNSSVTKLYDSVYLDNNGSNNVIMLFGSPQGSNNSDSSVASLTSIIVMPPGGNSVYQYNTDNAPFSNNVVEPSVSGATMTSTCNSWVYPSPTTVNTLNYNYQVLYFPWNKDVVVILFDFNSGKPQFRGVYSFFSGSSAPTQFEIPSNLNLPTSHIPDTDPNNNTFLSSNKSTYQVSKYIRFDTNAQAVLTYDNTGTLTATTPVTSSSGPVAVNDTVGGNIVVAVPFSNNRTMVCEMCPDPQNAALMTIRNVVRFDPNTSGGVVQGCSINSNPSTTSATKATTPPSSGGSSCPDMSAYILKSQVVPPVCPACPACPNVSNNVSCPACGKHGDNSSSSDGGSLAGIISAAYQQQVQQNRNTPQPDNSGANSAGGVINNLINQTASGVGTIGSTVTGLASGVENTASNLVGTAGSTIQGVVDSTGKTATTLASGAEGAVTGVADDATKIGQSAIGGATVLGAGAIGTVGGVADNALNTVDDLGSKTLNSVDKLGNNLTKSNGSPSPNGTASSLGAGYYQNPGMGSSGGGKMQPGGGFKTTGTPGFNDYYGAVPPRPTSNFMPVTADFSKFGR
jgi:hypothetical protein